MVFCNFLEIKAETKKVVGVKVVPFGVLYSCGEFRRLKMGDPVYIWYGDFYIWGIDAIKFLWRLGEGVGG